MAPREPEDFSKHDRSRLLSMGQIAAGIAHEVKNPLTSVKGFVRLLKEKYADEDYLEIVESELDDALTIISDFLAVTKPEMDGELPQIINLAFEIESVLSLFLERQYNIVVEKDFRDTDVTFYGKRQQLKRAFFNLLKNAFESIKDVGVVRIQHYAEGNHLVIVIEDTGTGIDEAKLDILGTPFFTTKADGTGMGLSQVYSTIYQHGGRIRVESRVGIGTTFYIHMPITVKEDLPLVEIDVAYEDNQTLREFMDVNRDIFRDRLLVHAGELTGTLKEIRTQSGVDLLSNAMTLVDLTLSNHPHELVMFAQAEGKLWAKHSLQVSFKLTWLQTIKSVLWEFIFNYCVRSHKAGDIEYFFQLERTINSSLDSFLSNFAISYNKFKDELLNTQRELVEDLSVPIIPLTSKVSILPLIGTIDTFRAGTVQSKVLNTIEASRLESMIIDLSGVSYMDTGVLNHLLHLFDGIVMMGCKAIVTGIRAEIAGALIQTGLPMGRNIIKRGNLQQALELIEFGK